MGWLTKAYQALSGAAPITALRPFHQSRLGDVLTRGDNGAERRRGSLEQYDARMRGQFQLTPLEAVVRHARRARLLANRIQADRCRLKELLLRRSFVLSLFLFLVFSRFAS